MTEEALQRQVDVLASTLKAIIGVSDRYAGTFHRRNAAARADKALQNIRSIAEEVLIREGVYR